jgi:hypothetical protein
LTTGASKHNGLHWQKLRTSNNHKYLLNFLVVSNLKFIERRK